MSISSEKNRATELSLSGAINFQNIANIEKSGQKLIQAQNEVTINMADAIAEDGAVLALLLSWKRFAKKHNKKMAFLNPNQQIKAMAHLGGVEELLWKN